MNDNEKLINRFYNSFAQRDYKAMQDCYADNATFSDEAFQNLNSAQVKAMWEMLIKRGKDLVLEYQNIQSTTEGGTAEWIAHYTFSQSGRKVVNHIFATFRIENGKIVQHIDNFDFYKWSRQALGIMGWLLGWSSFLQDKIRKTAMAGLDKFMSKT
jgi:ketosteroid isomerase-like protein